MSETSPFLSPEQREALLDDYQNDHPETWIDPRIEDADTLLTD